MNDQRKKRLLEIISVACRDEPEYAGYVEEAKKIINEKSLEQQVEFQLKQFPVYVKHDPDQTACMVTQILFCADGTIMYQLSSGKSNNNFYSCEISTEKTFL